MTATELRAALKRAKELQDDPKNGPWMAIGYLEAVLDGLLRDAERREANVGEGVKA